MINRETVRDALVVLLDAKLDGIVYEVVGHKLTSIEGKSPVVAVNSFGSDRPRMTFQGNQTKFHLIISSLVLASDEATWTPALAEDKLDIIEKNIAEVIQDNQITGDWKVLEYAGSSVVGDVALEGKPYIIEEIEIIATVYG